MYGFKKFIISTTSTVAGIMVGRKVKEVTNSNVLGVSAGLGTAMLVDVNMNKAADKIEGATEDAVMVTAEVTTEGVCQAMGKVIGDIFDDMVTG